MREQPRGSGRRTARKGLAAQQSPFWFRSTAILVGLILRFWVRGYRVLGADQVPPTGGVFVISNHTTGMDPFLLGYPIRHRRPHGPAKAKFFSNPASAFLIRRLGLFPIRQGGPDVGAVRAMVELYRAGIAVIVYPEGERTRTGELQPFFPEFARLVIKLKAVIVPAAIAGGAELMPVGTLYPRANRAVTVAFGRPFELGEFYGKEMTPALATEAASLLRDRVVEVLTIAQADRDEHSR